MFRISPRPLWISQSSILLLGSAILEPLRRDWPAMRASGAQWQGEIPGLLFNLGLFVTVSFFLWKGHPWARWVTFLLCCLCLLELGSLFEAQSVGKIVSTIYDAGLAIFLLVFLNTRPIRDWFGGRTTAIPPPPLPNANGLATKRPPV